MVSSSDYRHGDVHDLNRRWATGHSSTAIAEAGVLVHCFDSLEDEAHNRPWAPCNSGWCKGLQNFLSCSLLNTQSTQIFNTAGVVVSPIARIICAYVGDGGTQAKNDGGCGGGSWCPGPDHWWNCAYPPWAMDHMLEAQLRSNSQTYNEVVVDAAHWDSHLPAIIEGFFFVRGDRAGEDKARSAHASFVHRYPHENAPLLILDRFDATAPFKEAS